MVLLCQFNRCKKSRCRKSKSEFCNEHSSHKLYYMRYKWYEEKGLYHYSYWLKSHQFCDAKEAIINFKLCIKLRHIFAFCLKPTYKNVGHERRIRHMIAYLNSLAGIEYRMRFELKKKLDNEIVKIYAKIEEERELIELQCELRKKVFNSIIKRRMMNM